MFQNRSKILFIIVLLEGIFSLWFLSYFNYLDRLSYKESINSSTADLALLVQNMYTSTWWALIILVFCLITIFSLTSFIFREIKPLFIALGLWVVLLILAINVKDSFINNLAVIGIFIPIYVANIIAYLKQSKMKRVI